VIVSFKRIEAVEKTGPSASFLFGFPRINVVLFFFLFLHLFLVGCAKKPVDMVYAGDVMGTTYQVKISGEHHALGPKNMGKLIDDQLQKINKIFTTYSDRSELMLFNTSPAGKPQDLSLEMIDVLSMSRDVFALSKGSFDPTVASLVDLWGFGPLRTDDAIPSHESVLNLLPFVGFNRIIIDREKKTAIRLNGTRVDFSGIAKGYAADTVATLLNSLGVSSYLIEVGGELRAQGKKSNNDNWRIAIETPSLVNHGVQQIVQVVDSGVATSGDYRNYFEKNGIRYSHTIDPRTGYPVTHNLASVTVIAETASKADAFATSMMVLGPEAALNLAEENNLAAYFLVKSRDGFDAMHSSAFTPYIDGE
jgi:thiamine biosynthesis lipoprotein